MQTIYSEEIEAREDSLDIVSKIVLDTVFQEFVMILPQVIKTYYENSRKKYAIAIDDLELRTK